MIERNAPELFELYANKNPSSQQDFYKSLYKSLEDISLDAYQQRNYKVRHCEEELATYFSERLQRSLFNSEREGDRSGHVDIIVKALIDGKKVEWYGECKILALTGSNYDIHQGYKQLTTRYATGNYSEHGIIVFNKKNNNLKRVNDWWIYLRNKESIRNKQDCSISKKAFITQFQEESTGDEVNIWHFFVPLFYNPQDKSGLESTKPNISTALRAMATPKPNNSKKTK